MDFFGFSGSIKRRQEELTKRREALRNQHSEQNQEFIAAQKRTAEIVESKAAIRREHELRAEFERKKDHGAPDNGVGYEKYFKITPGSLRADSDRVIFPEDVLVELTKTPLVEYPIIFEIYSPISDQRTHCGVLEFSASEGQIVVPEKVLNCLGLPAEFSGEVRLRYKVLPKCSLVRLKVPESVFELFPDFRVFLESSLSQQYVTLTRGDTLMAGGGVPLIVDATEPESAVCIIDSEVRLDLILVEKEQTRWKLGEPAMVESQKRLWLEGQVKPGQVVELRANCDVDIFVSFWPLVDANMFSFDLTGTDISINFDDLKARGFPEYLTVGILGELDEVEISTRIVAADTNSQIQDTSQCKNCKRMIPSQSMAVHAVQCEAKFRFCVSCKKAMKIRIFDSHTHCPLCNVAYQTGEDENHSFLWHSPLICICGESVTRATLADHMGAECKKKPVVCRFCKCAFPRGDSKNIDARDRFMGFNEHEANCGNRTEACSLCHKRERLKDMDFHMQAFHSSQNSPPTSLDH